MNSSKVAVRGATLLVVVPSRGWSGFTSAADLLAVRESMNVCLTSGLTIRMDASTTFCGHIPITPRFWGVGHLRPLPPATDHATKCSRTIVSELIGSVNTSVFLVTYLVRLPTTGLIGTWPRVLPLFIKHGSQRSARSNRRQQLMCYAI